MFLFPMTKIVDLTPIMTHDEYVTLKILKITSFKEDTKVTISFNIPKGYGNKTSLNHLFSKIN